MKSKVGKKKQIFIFKKYFNFSWCMCINLFGSIHVVCIYRVCVYRISVYRVCLCLPCCICRFVSAALCLPLCVCRVVSTALSLPRCIYRVGSAALRLPRCVHRVVSTALCLLHYVYRVVSTALCLLRIVSTTGRVVWVITLTRTVPHCVYVTWVRNIPLCLFTAFPVWWLSHFCTLLVDSTMDYCIVPTTFCHHTARPDFRHVYGTLRSWVCWLYCTYCFCTYWKSVQVRTVLPPQPNSSNKCHDSHMFSLVTNFFMLFLSTISYF